MIHKDVQIGNVKGIYLIELGDGDIGISALTNKEEKYTGISFVQDKEKNPIGKQRFPAGGTTDDDNPSAVIIFKNIESLEVLEDAIKRAKIRLRNL